MFKILNFYSHLPHKKFMKNFKIINILFTIFKFLVLCDSFSLNKMTIFINIAPIKKFHEIFQNLCVEKILRVDSIQKTFGRDAFYYCETACFCKIAPIGLIHLFEIDQ